MDYYTATLVSASGSTAIGTWETSAAFEDLDAPVEDTKSFVVVVESKSQGSSIWNKVETWNVCTDPNALDDMGITRYAESVINRQSKFIRIAVNPLYENLAIACSTSKYFELAGGSNGTFSNALTTQCISAYSLYSNPEEVDVNIIIDSDKHLTVKQYMIALCEARMDAMAIIDPPYENLVNMRGNVEEGLRTWARNTLNQNTSYACTYANWLEVYDKWSGKYRWVPASGFAAGIFANTDSLNDAWFAPAGLNRGRLMGPLAVRRLAFNPKESQRDLLYKARLNPIVGFAGQGQVIWGQKTLLDKESAFNRINVRRLFMVLEKAIATAAKYYLFEPNDPLTRMLMVNMIEPFLRDVKARRGITSFQVICDDSNNTPERIDRNELYCDIYIKPVRAAEFIVLSFVATKTGVSFNEIAGTGTTV